jgi:exopolysaccharide production protein ExoZ
LELPELQIHRDRASGTSTLTPVSAEKKLLLIQALRAVAALMVVFHHAMGAVVQHLHMPEFEFYNGASGVDIFFVISGVVMAISSRSVLKYTHPARAFYARRIERIVPLYWIATTLKIVLVLFAPGLAVHALGSVWHVAASYLFLPTFHYADPNPVVIPGWTLNYEMFFYGLVAVALSVGRPLLVVLVPVLGALSVASFARPGAVILFGAEDSMALEFLFGVLLAQAALARKTPGKALSLLLLVGGFVPLFLFQPTDTMPRVLIWGVPALAIVTGAMGLEERIGGLVPRWLLRLGDASFALYLFHGFVMEGFGVVLNHIDGRRLLGIGVVLAEVLVSVFAALAIYRAVERPLMAYFRQRRVLRPELIST